MLDQETKRKINNARDVLVGKVPDPKAQVEQITTALIYKFMDDMDRQAEELGGKPSFFTDGFMRYSWGKLMDKKLSGQERLNLYVEAITKMSQNPHIPQLFRDIFKDAFLPYRAPETLHLFLKEINGFNYDNSENLGDAFEYLLSVMAAQGDAGQFRTPRHIIDFIVDVVNPQKDETILDPACGTAGFLISAYKHIIADHDGKDDITGKPTSKEKPLTPDEKKKMMNNFTGYDISPDMVRLSLVNMYLHGFSGPKVYEYDTLSSEDRWEESFDVIMANPPFMTPRGGIRPHKRFSVQANRSEVLFVDYILEHLNQKGRAGIIVPEGIIFQSANAYKKLRQLLIEDGLFAVISLPAGVFNPYSGVKTSILFFDNEVSKQTDEILFIKIENDGFNLGAQRREIEENDLPKALEIINKHKKSFDNKKVFLTGRDVQDKNIQLISKKEIAESGDYNLTGDRYKSDIYISLQNITQNLEKTFEPYKETLKQIQKQTEPYKELVKQLQRQGEQMNRIFSSPIFQQAQESMQKVAKQMQRAFEDVNFQKIFEEQKKLQEELKKRQKWEMVELGEVCEIKTGKKDVNQGNFDGKYPFFTCAKEHTFSNEYSFNTEAILIAGNGDVGTVKYYKGKFEAYQRTYVLSEFKKVLSKYLFYLLNLNLKEAVSKQKLGNTMPYIKLGMLQDYQIPLPSIEVQKEIVAELDGYQKIIDGAKQVIKSWKPSIKINPEWEMVKLGEICKTTSGGTPLKSRDEYYKNGIIPWLRSGEVAQGFIKKSKLFITKDGLKNSSAKMLPINTVLVAMYGATAGQVGLLKFKSSTNQAICGILPYDKFVPEFLFQILKDRKEDLVRLAGGGAQPNISQMIIKNLKIPLPSLKIQKKIVAEIEAEQKIIDQNKKLIKIFEEKIKEKIGEVWGG